MSGHGSFSGIGKGGGGGDKGDKGGKGGGDVGLYFFYFVNPQGKDRYRFIYGANAKDAIKKATQWGRDNGGLLPSSPLAGPFTKEDAKKYLEERRNGNR